MDKITEKILELSRDPMLAVERYKLVYMNSAAKSAFPRFKTGESAFGPLPKHLLTETADRFMANVTIDGRQYTVSAADCGDARLFSLTRMHEDSGGRDELVSYGLTSHLLTTILNADLSEMQLSKRALDGDGQDMERFFAILRHSHYSLKRQLVNLDMALRLRDNLMDFSPQRTDLVRLCEDLTLTVNGLFNGVRAILRFSSPLSELNAQVDAKKVERLLLNLISNSLEHTPPEGEILLSVNQSGGNAVLTVKDNGEGIPPDILRNVFTQYKIRSDAFHTERAATAGLGLGVASGLAKLHGGALVIESQVGQGTTACAMLPLEQPDMNLMQCQFEPAPYGMELILTELVDQLDARVFSRRYFD